MAGPAIRAAVLVVLLGVAFAPAAPAPVFPMAVWYSGGTARAPMLSAIDAASERAWRSDLQTIRTLGFNTVRTWVEWSAGEPREGDFRFDHPGVRRAVLRFFEETARRAAKSHAFHAYVLWSEPAVMNWAQPAYVPNAQFCYCSHSIARFREWVRGRYAAISDLNLAWYRTFTAWDEVDPPRFGTILTYADFMDWRVYIGDKIAADLKARAGAVRNLDPAHLVTSHAPNPSPVFRTLADPMDASDDYLMKEAVDYFGTSFYPRLTSPDRDFPLERRALVLDAARAVTGDAGFYVGELQAGYGVHGVIAGNPVTPADLELHAWSAVARGAKAISFYAFYPMSTGYESGGYGLINLDGSLTDRSRRAVSDSADRSDGRRARGVRQGRRPPVRRGPSGVAG